ncbi:hypothetical protein RIF29_27899 [Crotalaria pallida]|uniref:Uncharacterized protein n=1 Tax=Crotalaria pallida TaxID=3830 RepID=A0AAN9EUT1_CROPI
MARKNTKRSLADAENISMLLDKSTQMEKHFAGDRTHRFIRKEANVLPRKGNDTNFFYPYGGDQLGVKNLCKPQSPIQPDPSQPKNKPRSGVYFSPMNTGKFGPARTSTQHGSATALQAWGGSNMQKNILLQKHNASPRSLTLAKREERVTSKAYQRTHKGSAIRARAQTGEVRTSPGLSFETLARAFSPH